MALTFGAATSDRVDHGSAAALDNLTKFTYLLWLFPTTLTNLRMFLSKDDGAAANIYFGLSGTGGNIEFQVDWSTSAGFVRSSSTPLATTSKWYCVVATYDSLAAQQNHMYVGDLVTALSEPTYSNNTNGSGSQSDDSARSLVIGNDGTTLALQGRIAFAGVWNRAMSLAELQSQQFRPRVSSGSLLFTHYGFNGTDTQPDWSGNGNAGTVTGATVADHVPLSPFFGFDLGYGAFAVAAASGPPMRNLLGIGRDFSFPIMGMEWLRHRKNRIRRDQKQRMT